MNPGFPQHCVFTPAHAGTQASILNSRERAKWKAGVAALSETSQLLWLQYQPFAGGGRKQEQQHKGSGIPPAAAAPQGITAEELDAHSGFGCEYFVISKTC